MAEPRTSPLSRQDTTAPEGQGATTAGTPAAPPHPDQTPTLPVAVVPVRPQDVAFPPPAETPQPAFTGYELLGELGRGGMGRVYKARHTGLNRVVALKVILNGALAGPQELARFRKEAEAFARLHHPNIVQIYEVGEADGLPFFSLEFCSGGNLAQRLTGNPMPPRQAAALVEQLARAVHAVHRQGIIHRDLKPSNVLLSGDQVPKIADFGLAKQLDDEQVTQVNAVMGTPEYMAPEQAGGHAGEVGPATDVYALGVILYEMLTGRPPFHGLSKLDTLEQVRSQEPVPPRRLQPGLPPDLQTICLKCLEKDPPRRYASAEALAEDLRRFQAGEPILARPASPAERAWKWARRRPAVAALLAVCLLASAALVGTGVTYHLRLRSAFAEARREQEEARDSFRQALQTLDQMLAEVGAADGPDTPSVRRMRERIARKVLGFYQEFVDQRGNDPALRAEAARAQGRLADIQTLLGDLPAAERSYGRAIALLEAEARESPTPPTRRELARNEMNLGVLLKKTHDFAGAERALDRALALRRQLAAEDPANPDDRQDLATTLYFRGALRAVLAGRRSEAAADYHEALGIEERLAAEFPRRPDYRREWARTLNNLGILLNGADPAGAEKAVHQALAIQEGLLAEDPGLPDYRHELARTCNNLATLREAAGKTQEAEQAYGQALDLLDRLAADFPLAPDYREESAAVWRNLGLLLKGRGRPAEAEEAYGKALESYRKLARDFPATPDYRRQLALTQYTLGILLADRGRTHQAEDAYRQALPIQERLAADYPQVPEYHKDLGNTLNQLARVLYARADPALKKGQGREQLLLITLAGPLGPPVALLDGRLALAGARRDLEQAVREHTLCLKSNPADQPTARLLRTDYRLLASTLLRQGDYTGAAAAAEQLLQVLPAEEGDLGMEHARAAEFLARCVPLARADTHLPGPHRELLAQEYSRRAVELLREAEKQGFRDAAMLKRMPALDVLRGRPDFQKLLQDLEHPSPTAAGDGSS